MRMGPGKHLKGLTLMNGIVSPEEVCFLCHESSHCIKHLTFLLVRLLPRGMLVILPTSRLGTFDVLTSRIVTT